jgi:hypothetical protein
VVTVVEWMCIVRLSGCRVWFMEVEVDNAGIRRSADAKTQSTGKGKMG